MRASKLRWQIILVLLATFVFLHRRFFPAEQTVRWQAYLLKKLYLKLDLSQGLEAGEILSGSNLLFLEGIGGVHPEYVEGALGYKDLSRHFGIGPSIFLP